MLIKAANQQYKPMASGHCQKITLANMTEQGTCDDMHRPTQNEVETILSTRAQALTGLMMLLQSRLAAACKLHTALP
jgi:hypothetical protein